MVSGFQDFWVAGVRFYYQRDAILGVEQEWADLGVIQTVAPSLQSQRAELFDADGGIRVKVDTQTNQITESWDITTNNLSPKNLSLIFFGTPPGTFTQAQTEVSVTHFGQPGGLIKIKDAAGVLVWGMAAIAGVYATTATIATITVTAIVAATKVFTVSTDPTAIAGLAPGKAFVLPSTGLANVTNSRTYTVAARSATTLTAVESPAANETAITCLARYATAGNILIQGTDFNPYNLDRGIISLLSASPNFTVAGNLTVVYTPAALSGARLLNPQNAKGDVFGTGALVMGRKGNAEQFVREGRMQISPNGLNNIGEANDYANAVLTVSVLNDLTQAVPAGRGLAFKGALPSQT